MAKPGKIAKNHLTVKIGFSVNNLSS